MAKFGPVLDQIKTFNGSLMLESNHVALRVLASQISKFEDLSVINICMLGGGVKSLVSRYIEDYSF